MRSARHVPRDHCLAPERVDAPIGAGGRYGRMFDLPPLEADERLLHELGAAGGFCDGGDVRPRRAGSRPAGRSSASTSPTTSPPTARPCAPTPTSPRCATCARRARTSSRSTAAGRWAPVPVRRDDPAKLLEDDGDLPRNQEGIALIGDPRNDVHVFMNQLQVAFIRAHNRLVDRLRADGVGEGELFAEARRALTAASGSGWWNCSSRSGLPHLVAYDGGMTHPIAPGRVATAGGRAVVTETPRPAGRVHVVGAGPVGLFLTALLQSVDGQQVRLYERRTGYTRTRMVSLADYLLSDSIESYKEDSIDGQDVEALFDMSELETRLAYRRSVAGTCARCSRSGRAGSCR